MILEEEGTKFVLTKSWRWMPGMLTLAGDRVRHISDDGRVILDRGYVSLNDANNWCVVYPPIDPCDIPDLRDAATIGACVEVLHRVSGDVVSLFFTNGLWQVDFINPHSNIVTMVTGASKSDALLASFEFLDR